MIGEAAKIVAKAGAQQNRQQRRAARGRKGQAARDGDRRGRISLAPGPQTSSAGRPAFAGWRIREHIEMLIR